jgi:hypothetical protein
VNVVDFKLHPATHSESHLPGPRMEQFPAQ